MPKHTTQASAAAVADASPLALEAAAHAAGTVVVAFEQVANTTAAALVPMGQLPTAAHKTHIIPTISADSLLSIRTLAKNVTTGTLV